MALQSIFGIAGAGMTAQTHRLNVVASNLANANSTTSADGKPYRAREVVFAPIAQPGADAGAESVQVTGVVEDQSPLKQVYDPGNPAANKDGYVMMPNVDPVEEMVNMISASRSYEANADVMNVAKNLLQKTLQLGQG